MTARRPLRVAIVAASDAIIGGHSVQATALEAALTAEGVDVLRMPIDRALPAAIRRRRGVRTVVNEAAYGWALRALAGVDVVHAFSASYWSFLLAPVPAMLAGRMLRRRVVLHYHSGEVADHLAHWGWRVHPWLRLADEVVVCSRFQQQVFASYGYVARVIPNLVDTSRFVFRDRRPIRPRFICTRNFEAHYGIDVVVEAFALIQAQHPDATLVLVGSGSQRDRLIDRVESLGLTGVRFAGAIPPDQMPVWLDGADVFLNASRIDNQPVSLLEAAASGLPVISTGVGGIGELVTDGESGMVVREGDPPALADAALALLAEPDRASAMARRACAGLSRFTWPAVRSEWEAAYDVRLPASSDFSPGPRPAMSWPVSGASA